MLDELTHVVQARRKEGDCDLGWHTIAAFNVKIVAEHYARDCSVFQSYEYRVVPIKGRK